MRKLILVLSVSCLFGCSSNESTKLFTAISSMHSGIDFENTITESYSQNFLTNEYTYMGGGVGIGDFNNDRLSDIFLTASHSLHRLYVNEGV